MEGGGLTSGLGACGLESDYCQEKSKGEGWSRLAPAGEERKGGYQEDRAVALKGRHGGVPSLPVA